MLSLRKQKLCERKKNKNKNKNIYKKLAEVKENEEKVKASGEESKEENLIEIDF